MRNNRNEEQHEIASIDDDEESITSFGNSRRRRCDLLRSTISSEPRTAAAATATATTIVPYDDDNDDEHRFDDDTRLSCHDEDLRRDETDHHPMRGGRHEAETLPTPTTTSIYIVPVSAAEPVQSETGAHPPTTIDTTTAHTTTVSEDDESEIDYYYDNYLLLLEEEEEQAQRQWLEDESRAREADFWARLEDQLQVFREVYSEPSGPASHSYYAAARRILLQEEEEEATDFFLPAEILKEDAQIEDLVARCETRDREILHSNNYSCIDRTTTTATNQSSNKPPPKSCVICLDAPRTHAFVPCGHLCVCHSCAREHSSGCNRYYNALGAAASCPICQQPSTLVLRIFVP